MLNAWEERVRMTTCVVSALSVLVIATTLVLAQPWSSSRISYDLSNLSDEQVEEIARRTVSTTTDITPRNGFYGSFTVSGPNVKDFSSEQAWLDYEKNWQNPAWDGEYPEGMRVKTAAYDNGGWTPWVAGVVDFYLNIRGLELSDDEDEAIASIADCVGARAYVIVTRNFYEDLGFHEVRCLFFFDEDLDVPSESYELYTPLNESCPELYPQCYFDELSVEEFMYCMALLRSDEV